MEKRSYNLEEKQLSENQAVVIYTSKHRAAKHRIVSVPSFCLYSVIFCFCWIFSCLEVFKFRGNFSACLLVTGLHWSILKDTISHCQFLMLFLTALEQPGRKQSTSHDSRHGRDII